MKIGVNRLTATTCNLKSYDWMYRKQCERYHNAALEEEFSQKRAEMMEIIKKAELEAEYGKYKKELTDH